MSSEQPDEERIFRIARNISDPGLRAEYLDQVCAGDQHLRSRVESLLAVHEQEHEFLTSGSPNSIATADYAPISESPGTTIGRYRLMEQIGEGGMGVVFVAEQQRPLRRKVALKVIKPGMDSKAVIARFEAERQTLALMDHPNIAKVLDAGTTDTGRPYFVMELVRGIPITEYCDQSKLSIPERLELFVQVCHAIQHAHQKAIIHRDIKPTNVLVTEQDGKPVPKVIDFGVAKALNQRLTERTIYTSFQAMIGTPLYMSPEQAALSAVDVDTRSDVYSLGVLLYELLTGTTPFDRKRFETAAYDELRRIVREEEPPKPSTKISTLGETGSTVAQNRRTEPGKLGRAVRGDLDWIVMKSLEKDRNRRYESAAAFAEDVTRFFGDEPVVARPPSRGYRFRKFAVRNKSLLATLLILTLALSAGITGTTWFALGQRNIARQLKATVERLVDSLKREAITAAMGGNEQQAETFVKEMESVGASPSLCANLRALAFVYSGKPHEAERVLTEGGSNEPTDLSALCTLWLAALYSGEPDKFSEYKARLGDRQPSEFDDIGKLLYAQVNLYRYPEASAAALEELKNKYRNWPVLQALYGSALMEQAAHGPDYQKTLEEFKKPLQIFQIAYALAPQNRFVRTEYLMALTYALELAEAMQLDDERSKAWGPIADQLAHDIASDRTDGGQWSLAIRAYYLVRINRADPEPLLAELVANSKTRQADFQAIRHFESRDDDALREVASVGDVYARTLQAMLEVELADEAAKKDLVSSAYKRLGGDNADFVRDEHRDAVNIFLFAGEFDEAKQRATNLLKKPDAFSSRWERECLEYLADPTPENEGRLLDLAGPYGVNQTYACYHVAMVALAQGDRDKARRYFQKVVDAGKIDWGFCLWSGGFLQRIDESDDWPSWIALGK